MDEGMPYLQMWRGVWVSFWKIAIVSFLSVKYKSDSIYCRMEGTPSSPIRFFIRVGIEKPAWNARNPLRPHTSVQEQDAGQAPPSTILSTLSAASDEQEEQFSGIKPSGWPAKPGSYERRSSLLHLPRLARRRQLSH